MGIRSGGATVDGDTPDVDPSTIEVPDGFDLVDGGPLAKNNHGQSSLSLLWCPACQYVFGYGEHRGTHISDHDAEDFGLG